MEVCQQKIESDEGFLLLLPAASRHLCSPSPSRHRRLCQSDHHPYRCKHSCTPSPSLGLSGLYSPDAVCCRARPPPIAVLASTFLLYAVGLGEGAIPTAGALSWVLKDGLGQLGTLLFGRWEARRRRVALRSLCCTCRTAGKDGPAQASRVVLLGPLQ